MSTTLELYPFLYGEQENVYFKEIGPRETVAKEDWTIVQLYKLIGGKYKNTFQRMKTQKHPVDVLESIIVENKIQVFERPIIEY